MATIAIHACGGRTVTIEVEGTGWVSAQRDVGIPHGYFEDFEAWHDDGRPFTDEDYDLIDLADEVRIFELLNGPR